MLFTGPAASPFSCCLPSALPAPELEVLKPPALPYIGEGRPPRLCLRELRGVVGAGGNGAVTASPGQEAPAAPAPGAQALFDPPWINSSSRGEQGGSSSFGNGRWFPYSAFLSPSCGGSPGSPRTRCRVGTPEAVPGVCVQTLTRLSPDSESKSLCVHVSAQSCCAVISWDASSEISKKLHQDLTKERKEGM